MEDCKVKGAICKWRFFQIISGFGHEIKIYTSPAEFPDWISPSSDFGSSMSLDLPPNVSHNFLAMVLCFKRTGHPDIDLLNYSVHNTTSDFKWTDSVRYDYHDVMIIVLPRSIFSVNDGDETIELRSNQGIIGIHLMYQTENTTDEHDSSIVNVEDESSYPSKRLKHLESVRN
ncbi:hypothetical protein POM88_052466 [Heracleum sosnowskyi]|uniref:Uncharacterized protein n=1 Tax=Heracleum sosnowskyi TaxID=360622 RepID=A0AAD8GRP7_9APIA|nr:hypothetical protein POM88_052466 [Heracleum sosnowskyi]